MVGSLPDIIMCRNFHVEIFRDYDFTGGLISHLPLILHGPYYIAALRALPVMTLSSFFLFNVAVETLGPYQSRYTASSQKSAEQPHFASRYGETTFLPKRIFMAIQHFNAVCLANTFTVFESLS